MTDVSNESKDVETIVDGDLMTTETNLNASLQDVGPSRSLAQDAWRRFKRNKLAMFGLFLVVFLVLVAIFGPMIVDIGERSDFAREKPTKQHWFGTDPQGYDIFAQVIRGIRLSILDTVLMRIVDILLGIPYLLFAFALIAIMGRGIGAMVGTIAVTAWLQTARTVRAGFIQAKNLEYVEAARALGVKSGRIMWRHILPNVFQPVIVLIAVGIGSAILAEAALSFLGVGIQAPQVSLGLMVKDATTKGLVGAPHMLIFPGLAIVLTVLGFLLVGDGLRDALDVKDT